MHAAAGALPLHRRRGAAERYWRRQPHPQRCRQTRQERIDNVAVCASKGALPLDGSRSAT